MGINSNSARGAMRRGAIMAGLLASAVSVPAFGQTVANPGFETGDTTGWTLNGGIWSSGWPPPQSQYSGPATIATITTTGFGDITLPGPWGKLTAIVAMIVGITLFVRLAQALFRPNKVWFPCPECALQRHEPDAVYCKACGHKLKIPDEGD